MARATVAVVGGGITGLVVARRLDAQGHRVTLLEAGDRLGGQVRTAEVADRRIDVGAEALHVAGPAVEGLVRDLDLGPELVSPTRTWTWIWTARGLRRLPDGFGPAGPSRIAPLVGARIMSPAGLARAALEPLVPRTPMSGDVAVGTLLAHRFGAELVERLVDPLLGGLHAGDVHRLSARAATPHLVAALDRDRSLVLARRRQPAPAAPVLATLPDGLGTLPDRLLAGTGVEVRRARVTSIRRAGHGYRLDVTAGPPVDAGAIVLAVPLPAVGRILAELVPALPPVGLAPAATVATVVLAYPRPAATLPALAATGILVPSSSGRLLKAATFLGTKWPHLHDDRHVLVRLSAGRAGSTTVAELDDDELCRRLRRDLADATGLRAAPVDACLQRWPDALPQLHVGHLDAVQRFRAALATHPRIAVAGASIDGVGLAACVRSGQSAADAIRDALDAVRPDRPVPA